ncbi:hypothetical protein [Paenibacillus physcomitrellae]|uniref:Uncharacterized protein n=1 Tax=Paenibacillus physcomitrellae TaxID=1619311 RepID=A0ABQ1GYV1_9BACL|nr:hypothetical protein [Paenibacillus physcomitrellae]GGA52128.1 hypothetical protein GCM10010917_41710 [Paenibacillus physcomitrellae]
MERSGEEMTRAMLLNSQSRGSLEEVAGEDDPVEWTSLTGVNAADTGEEEPFYAQWEGRDLTRQMYLQSYD